MKNLDQYIHDHKDLFDEEPENGHFERFQQKVNKENNKVVMLRWGASIAASIVLLLSVGTFWMYTHQSDDSIALCETSTDMKLCYMDKMNEVAYQIYGLTKDMDQWDRQQIIEDVQNIIDATNDDFKSEIPEELPKDEADSILSDYYQHNLNSLQNIAETLKEE